MKKSNFLSNLKYAILLVIALIVGLIFYGTNISNPEFKEVSSEIKLNAHTK
ncbi:MAG: hypothetical protein J0G32_05560 [Alphaproteobacteria bacterium]|nr:hypothetical protein [Alphaproteobacteria bacterium]